MDYRSWHVGMRVVCICDDEWCCLTSESGASSPVRVPMLNEVLTIKEMGWGMSGLVGNPRPIDKEGLFLSFEEIPLRQVDGSLSAIYRWNAAYFRPLIERPTDISCFTALLTGAKERSKEPAHG